MALLCAAPPHSSGHIRQPHSGPGPGRARHMVQSHASKKTLTKRGGSAVGKKWRPTDPITPDYTGSLAGSNVITILGWIVVSSRDKWSIENTTTTTTTSPPFPFPTPFHRLFDSGTITLYPPGPHHTIIAQSRRSLGRSTMDDKTVSPLATISAGMATSAPTSPKSGGGGGSAKGGGGGGGGGGGPRTCDNCRKRKVSRVDPSGTR
jgi:hypothetical protein